jgi:predicted aminopeptidase
MIRRTLAAALAAALVSGCETVSYYSQAVGGHLALMTAARPAADVIADPGTPPALRTRLETALRIRAFAARELHLPDNASYTSYVELDRPYVVWNVFAAGEFSLEAKTHCFPVAGCVSYRGFFAEKDAREFAGKLAAGGDDVFVAGVPAYSTLGWFDDPLLSTFMRGGDTETARLVFHELAHQLVYVRDDTTFNESFATTVEQEGVRRWLAREGRAAEFDAFLARQRRKSEFLALLKGARERLAPVYRLDLLPAAMRDKKRAEFEALRRRYEALKASWGGYSGYDRIFGREPNNALLIAFAAYTQLVPAFERLLKDAGGDLPAFYARVKEIAALPKERRSARLEGLAGAARS